MQLRKITSLLLLCCFISASLFAQKSQEPQEILGVARENKSAAYYQEQSKLWQKETVKDSKYSYAYWQWYKAERSYLIRTSKKNWPNNRNEVYKKLSPIVAKAKKNVGQSFEYHFMEHTNTITEGFAATEFLKKAYEIDPSRVESYDSMLIHYITTFDKKGAKEIAQKMLEANFFSNANLMWNYNSLQTAEQNGVFISQGDMDGLPRWALQYAEGIRPDVTVISKWLLGGESYRNDLFKKINIPAFKKTRADFDNNQTKYVDAMVVHIMKNYKYKTYIGCGTPVSFFEKQEIEDDVYLVGLAFVYSKKGINNIALTKENFEQKYDLEYLFNNFQKHEEDQMVKTWMNITYIPGLMKMKEHYEGLNESGKANYYSTLIEQIAEDSGRRDEIMGWY
ncbi:MAG: hypothetical protein AB8F74_12875 [Saprospiraceae bacterium]